ncbi:MAG TPA: basic amino acid ABC transporter substrate-binding protein [Spirochaetota bacterium]|nr:basic amino acid ABC transporter substrate-binding protein [Spirochaetota bacterium]
MKRFLVLISAIVLILGVVSFSCKKEKLDNKIVIATDATWPPMEFVNENKEIVGFDIDLMKEIAKQGGFEVEFKNTAWDGIFAGLENGDYDAVISSVTITDERKETMDFSMPYINAGQVLIVTKSTSTTISKLEDLKGKSVGAQIGTTGAFEIQKIKEITLRTYDELGLAIEDLANNKIDGVVADTPIAANYVLQNPQYKDKLKIVTEPFTQEFYGIAIKKGNTKVIDMINGGLKKVLDSGKNNEIEGKWLR